MPPAPGQAVELEVTIVTDLPVTRNSYRHRPSATAALSPVLQEHLMLTL